MLLKKLFWWVPFGAVPEISATDLHNSIANGDKPFIIDVRTRQEFKESHIAGAVNLPLSSLKRDFQELKVDPDQPVVAICRSARRSIPAVRLFSLNGFTDARQLQGGMNSWWNENLPTNRRE